MAPRHATVDSDPYTDSDSDDGPWDDINPLEVQPFVRPTYPSGPTPYNSDWKTERRSGGRPKQQSNVIKNPNQHRQDDRRRSRRRDIDQSSHRRRALHTEDSTFRCHPYHIPTGGPRHAPYDLWMEVPIHDTEDEDILSGTWPWPQVQGAGHVASSPVYWGNIAAAKSWSDPEGQHRLDLTTAEIYKKPEEDAAYPFNWLHVQTDELDFDEFQTIALNTPDLSRDWKVVVLSLLKRVRQLAKTSGGNSWEPWVLRADSAELTMPKKHEKPLTAISVSFPFFALDRKSGVHSMDAHKFPGAGLFRWIADRNFEQLFPQMIDEEDAGDFIYSAHVWCLILDTTLITYGSVSHDDLCGKSISMLQGTLTAAIEAPSIVQLIDEWGCTFLFELRECRSFFALQKTVERHCLRRSGVRLADLDIITGDDRVLTGSIWVSVINSERSQTIQLFLRKKLPMLLERAPQPVDPREELDTPHKPDNLPTSINQDIVLRSLSAQAQTRLRTDVVDEYGISKHLESMQGVSVENDLAEAAGGSEEDTKLDRAILADTNMCREIIVYRGTLTSSAKANQLPDSGRLGQPDSLILVNRRRSARIEAGLRIDWMAEGVVCDVPLFRRMGVTNFVADPISQELDNMRLDMRGLVAFAPNRTLPTTYEIPTERHASRAERKSTQIPKDHAASRQAAQNVRSGSQPEWNIHDRTQEKTQTGKEPQSATTPTEKRSSSRQLDPNVSLPRFLDWANTCRNEEKYDLQNEGVIPHVERILQALHENLSDVENTGRAGAYKWVKEASRAGFEADLLSLGIDISGAPHAPLHSEGQKPSAKVPQRQQTKSGKAATAEKSDWLHNELHGRAMLSMAKLCHFSLKLLDCYLVPSYAHSLILKCWGALHVFVTKLKACSEDKFSAENTEAAFWITRDASSDAIDEKLPQPSRSWSHCKKCSVGTIYRTREEGVRHVQSIHFRAKDDHGKVISAPDDVVDRWLRDDQQYRLDQRLALYLSYLDMALGHLLPIHDKAILLREGTATNAHGKSRKYKLPNALVKAFENIVMLLMYTALAFQLVDSFCKRLEEHLASKDKQAHHRLPLEDVMDNLDVTGSAALLLLAKSEQDLMLMAYTNFDAGAVRYDAVGPEYLLATICANLSRHPLHKKDQIEKVYSKYYDKLNMEVLNHPRARIIRDIFMMHEEIVEVNGWVYAQHSIMEDYRRVLQPCSYEITTKLRCSRFTAEDRFLCDSTQQTYELEQDWDRLDARLQNLNRSVFQILRVRDENSGNAIMVFTIVATIFLPLSWATSYLGMNTADIRELRQGQWLFWTIAGPVAALVIGVAMIVVVKGEEMREYMIKRQYKAPKFVQTDKTGMNRSNTIMSSIAGIDRRGGHSKKSWLRTRGRRSVPEKVAEV